MVYVGGKEPKPGFEGGGADLVEASFDLEEQGGGLEPGVLTLWGRAREASEELRPGREPYCLG